MKRYWYAKYAVTLLASTAITFHLLYSQEVKLEDNSAITQPPPHLAFQRRRLSQGTPPAPGWVVLPGNVTVHEGEAPDPYRASFDIDASDLCQDFDPTRPTLLIFVASSVDHVEQRNAIRETWGLRMLQKAYNFRVAFLVGETDDQTAVAQEGYRHGDLVQIGSLAESFRNLGKKSVAGLQWSSAFCAAADFVMKTDDDILVHVPNLLKAFEGRTRLDPLLTCHENRMRKILRKDFLTDLPESYRKYEVTQGELPGRFYPPYCSGMAYAFSGSVRDRLLAASDITPVFFIEDVYLTGFCRHKAGVDIRPHPGIGLRPPVLQPACGFRDGRVTSHEVGAAQLRDMWRELNTQGFFCPRPLGIRSNVV